MTEVSNGVRVFVSYARADGSEFVKDLVPALEAAGFDLVVDPADVDDELRHLVAAVSVPAP